METKILDKIGSPADLRILTFEAKEQLAGEIRDELIDVISKNGGHLAPNLGVVELTIALHCAFKMPEDKIVWDIGHQAYVHKILTGRREFFKTLRMDEGCLGFLSRDESEYDVFGAGHAGTAISAALGMAAARDRKNGKEKIVAVVGDGSLNCGVSFEALNHVAETTKDFIIILNDNKMSISKNVGGMSRYLNRIITGRGYNKFKNAARTFVEKIPRVGSTITGMIGKFEEATKSILVPGVLFEELGFRYVGPIDGHNIEEMTRTFEGVREFEKPVIVHVITEKGRGYKLAEDAPEKFHGLASFDPETGEAINGSSMPSFSTVFGNAVSELAEKQKNVVAITAGMCTGTGLLEFSKKYPDKFFDVGIAEEHAIVFAAGMATQGFVPVVAIYSTFLQRALDYVLHDVCLQKLPVIICEDRSGIVEDGATHHGIHDLSFLRNMPNISILCPADGCELRNMLFTAYERKEPVVIRYPRGSAVRKPGTEPVELIPWGKSFVLKEGKDIAIWASGRELSTAIEVAEILAKSGKTATVVNARFMKPFDNDLLLQHAAKMPVATIEDCQIQGGLGSIVDETLIKAGHKGVFHFGWGNDVIPHGTIAGIRKKSGFTAEAIAAEILK
ncbi:MAG TPA: 1-deoxy-D-xylulose-5-phosphate synthase [Lentisphaeria bacterium]|nr:MAG: 1-deoxy-D-xylulose-5-phosphate synthase [Lentisphaerae bacterium GWF2_49_21]HBC85844.1 1-deoxy-D-xylulose-5-phosphate synthase [Lentisphaeria bacterium]